MLVRLPQQAEEPAQRFDDRGDPLFAHPFGWCLGEAESGLRRLLDRGGLADPAGQECRVSSGIDGAPVAGDFGVAVVDRLAQPRRLVALLMLSERSAVAGIGNPPQRLGEVGVSQLFAEEAVDWIRDRFLPEVEDGRMGDAVLADVVAGCLAPVIDASVVDAALPSRGRIDRIAAGHGRGRGADCAVEPCRPRRWHRAS